MQAEQCWRGLDRKQIAVGIHIIAGTTLCPAGREGVVKVLRKLGNLERIRNERSLTVEELSKASGVPRNTIVGLEEGTESDSNQVGRGARSGA